MKKPNKRMFQIAAMVATGKTQTETAARFGISVQAVGASIHRVRDYQAGQAILQANPLSVRGLAQTGVIRESTARALEVQGITDLRQLADQGKQYMRAVQGIGPISHRRILAILKCHDVYLVD
jgi:hypothetical protein